MAGLNPFPSKSQCRVARPRQAQLPVGMLLVRLYLFLRGMIEAKCQMGKGKRVLTESIREHRLHGAFLSFPSPSQALLEGDSVEGRRCREAGLGVTKAGSVAHEVLCAQYAS